MKSPSKTARAAFVIESLENRLLLSGSHVHPAAPALGITHAYIYTNFSDTEAWGISGTTVVGQYHNLFPNQEGFIYDAVTGVFTPIQYPGGADTIAFGVFGSTVIGTYGDTITGATHGFIYNETTGTYTTVDHPNAGVVGTDLGGISGNTIVGEYSDRKGKDFGFVYNQTTGVFTPLDVPNGSPSGISGNTIVGTYLGSDGVLHGFIYNQATNTYTTLDEPNADAAAGTRATGISGNNIVGYYENRRYKTNGFIYDQTTGTFTRIIDFYDGTQINGISGSTIVGDYPDQYEGEVYDAFIGVPAASISGLVFNNRDGAGIPGITLTLQKVKRGHPSGRIQITTADGNGDYSFPLLPSANYRVTEVLPRHSTLTTPQGGSYTIYLVAGQNSSGNNFGDHVKG